MQQKFVIGIILVVIISVFALLVWRKNDSMSKVQRDIAESLERAKLLKTERDSLAKLEDQRRFAKKWEDLSAGSGHESEEAGRTGHVRETREISPSTLRQTQGKPSSGTDVVMVNSSSTSEVPAFSPSIESASVPAERFFTTDAMDGLTPAEKKTEFKPGDIVYIYAGIHAPQAEQVRLEWFDVKGKLLPPPHYVNIESNMGSNGFRIYKNRKFQSVGKYAVRLYNSSGKMIGETEFNVSE